MRPNRTYQATVEALETVLAPRVVSLVLREGLAQTGRQADDLTLDDVEAMLTGPAFRHLQALMPVEQARETVTGFLNRIRDAVTLPDEAPADRVQDAAAAPSEPPPGALSDQPVTAVADRLEALREALRPFNLYFDWPEVRTLRAHLQVAEQELSAGVDAEASLHEAAAQLQLAEQKLEDRLVLQARELADLEEAYEIVQVLGGPRVRRLEALVGQIRQAQAARELAEAETERAATIARDLRKLMESSVAQPAAAGTRSAETPPAQATPPPAAPVDAGPSQPSRDTTDDDLEPLAIDDALLTPEASERLRRLDVEAELKHLDALHTSHAELLRYLPAIAQRMAAARAQLERGEALGDELERLRQSLHDATDTQRHHLRGEIEAMEAELDRLRQADDGSLERALRVALDVIDDGLPRHVDMQRLRDLHRAAVERLTDRERRDAEIAALDRQRRAAHEDAIRRLEEAIGRDPGGAHALEAQRQALAGALAELRSALAEDRLEDAAVDRALQAEEAWERALAARADGLDERLRARLRALDAHLTALPETPTLASRRSHLAAELARAAQLPTADETHVATLATLVEQLAADARSDLERQLDQLGKEAGDVSSPPVLKALQDAATNLQAGSFPDLARLRALVADERERLRSHQRARWQTLQQAHVRLEPSGVPAQPAFSDAVDRARAALHAGAPAGDALDAAERALERVQEQVRERLAGFASRLDRALGTFTTVERLNNDDVATVRRTLHHLDTQRDALPRVSPGLQYQLDRALSEAEALLVGLSEAYEATRAVADQLVAGNVLDDVLGWLDGPTAAPPAAPAADAARGTPDVERLRAVTDGFQELDDVVAAAVVGADGSLLAGDLAGMQRDPLHQALGHAAKRWAALAEVLGDDPPEQVVLALGGSHALVAPLGSGAHALVVVRSGGPVSALTARLRDRRSDLANAVDTAR